MMLNHLRIETIDQNVLQSWIDDKVGESKTLGYKSELPKKTDSDRKEFLSDVCSFANASGGFLFFGIEAQRGTPTSICGLGQINAEQEVLRLEGIVQNGIEPRPPGLQSTAVPTSRGVVIAMRIPRSWVSPHMVTFHGDQWFIGRNSAGKYPLDVGEIKRLEYFPNPSPAWRLREFAHQRRRPSHVRAL